jgi:hypothetical protein
MAANVLPQKFPAAKNYFGFIIWYTLYFIAPAACKFDGGFTTFYTGVHG